MISKPKILVRQASQTSSKSNLSKHMKKSITRSDSFTSEQSSGSSLESVKLDKQPASKRKRLMSIQKVPNNMNFNTDLKNQTTIHSIFNKREAYKRKSIMESKFDLLSLIHSKKSESS